MIPQSTDTPVVIARLLDIAPALESALRQEWPGTRDELARLAARIDDLETTALRVQLDELLERLLAGPAAPEVRRLLARTSAGPDSMLQRGPVPATTQPPHLESGGPGLPVRLDADGVVVVPVFYGTSRTWRGSDNLAEYYTAERSDLAFGVVEVSVPTNHKLGELESPRWWRFERNDNPTKHFVLLRLNRLDEPEFVDRTREAVAGLSRPEVLLFIHGYNVPFSNAAKRAAQIAVDLKFDGAVLLYSWPSVGDARLYMVDEATVEFCRPHLEQFLRIVLVQTGAGALHVIAHSMGNRPLVTALERLNPSDLPRSAAKLRQVVFAAPDVDCDVFRQLAAAFRGRAQRCTLYASSNDFALRLSKALHRYPRAGDAGTPLLVVDGVDTVDASGADTSLFGLGHSYFAQRRSILSDLYHLIRDGMPPERRFDLAPADGAHGRYWKYRN